MDYWHSRVISSPPTIFFCLAGGLSLAVGKLRLVSRCRGSPVGQNHIYSQRLERGYQWLDRQRMFHCARERGGGQDSGLKSFSTGACQLGIDLKNSLTKCHVRSVRAPINVYRNDSARRQLRYTE